MTLAFEWVYLGIIKHKYDIKYEKNKHRLKILNPARKWYLEFNPLKVYNDDNIFYPR